MGQADATRTYTHTRMKQKWGNQMGQMQDRTSLVAGSCGGGGSGGESRRRTAGGGAGTVSCGGAGSSVFEPSASQDLRIEIGNKSAHSTQLHETGARAQQWDKASATEAMGQNMHGELTSSSTDPHATAFCPTA